MEKIITFHGDLLPTYVVKSSKKKMISKCKCYAQHSYKGNTSLKIMCYILKIHIIVYLMYISFLVVITYLHNIYDYIYILIELCLLGALSFHHKQSLTLEFTHYLGGVSYNMLLWYTGTSYLLKILLFLFFVFAP